MTTKDSPVGVLRAQANQIATAVKNAAAGSAPTPAIAAKVALARQVGVLTVGVAMDDKIITIEIPLATIESTPELELTEYILKLMQESRS